MGILRRSGFGWLGLGALALGCGQSAHDNGACNDCSNGGGGGSSGLSGSAATAGHGGAQASVGGGSAAQAGSSSPAGTGGSGGHAGDVTNGGSAGESGSTPERVVAVTRLLNLIVKNGYVYYSDAEDNDQEFTSGHLRGVSVTGGTPRLYAQAPSVPDGTASSRIIWGIVSDGTSLYWSEDPTGATSHVAKTSIETGETADLWQDSSCGIRKPLALDGTQVYWLAGCVGVSGQLMTASTAGGSASVVSSGNDAGWQGNPSGSNEEARGLAVGNGFAMWTQVTGAVVSLPLSGAGTPLQFKTITEVDGPSEIALLGDRAWFLQPDYMDQAKGDIWSFVPDTDFLTEANSMVHVAQLQPIEEPTSLAVDDGFVYWGVTNAIQRAPLAGGNAVAVVSALPNPDPRALAVDETHIYWADDTGIWRALKPQ